MLGFKLQTATLRPAGRGKLPHRVKTVPISDHEQFRVGTQGCRGPFLTAYFAVERHK